MTSQLELDDLKTAWARISELAQIDLAAASGERLLQIRRAFRAVFADLLWVSTQTIRESVDDFIKQAQSAQFTLQSRADHDAQHNFYFYLGQLNAVVELSSMIRHQAIPASAMSLLARSQVAQDIVRVVLQTGSISPRDLAQTLSRHSQNLVNVTKQLVQAGLLRRDDFGRSARLSPTPLTRTAWLFFDIGGVSSLLHDDEEKTTEEPKRAVR